MSTLDAITLALTEATAHRPRTQQVATGASQLLGCRAEAVLRLTGAPASNPRLSWPAEVGSAVHDRIEHSLVGTEVLIEQKYTYRNVVATVDLLWPKRRTLTDIKTKGSAADIVTVSRDGPPDKQRAQVHVGAAAAIEAGIEVDTVELLYLPRDGDLADAWLFSEPFDRSLADKACEWAAETQGLAEQRASLPEGERADGLRDQPPSWCRAYCVFADLCRGPAPEVPEVDEAVRDVAAEYLAACVDEEVAAARKRRARDFLQPIRDLRSVGLTWAGGGTKLVPEEDLSALRELYVFTYGELPTVLVERTSPRSLRRVKR